MPLPLCPQEEVMPLPLCPQEEVMPLPLCPGGLYPGGSLSGGLCPGVFSVRGSLCRLCQGDPPYGERAGGTHPTGKFSCFESGKPKITDKKRQ